MLGAILYLRNWKPIAGEFGRRIHDEDEPESTNVCTQHEEPELYID